MRYACSLPSMTTLAGEPAIKSLCRTLLQPLSIGYRLEFKICVKEGHTFKRWENFPSDRNRIYMTDCRYVKLKVIENSLELVTERKHRTVSSDEMVALELHPAHKYDSRNV